VYNGEKYINEAIDSILNQTFQNFELLIINDASTDSSQNCIDSYDDKRIKVIINEKNLGLVQTLNKGLKIASGKYIARFDQDDISLPNRLKNQYKFLEENKDISAICSWMITIDSNGNKTHYFNQKIRNFGDFIGFIIIGKVPLYHPAVMYRKADILDIKGYNLNFPMAEDYDLWRRMAECRLNISIINKYDLLQRQHDSNETKIHQNKYEEAGYKIQFETIEKFSNCKDTINNCLSSLLRLSPDPCGKNYDKEHLKELVIHLEKNIIRNISTDLKMSKSEINILKSRLYKRLGYGIRYIRIFSILPNLLFIPTLLILSPLIRPNIYTIILKIYRKFQKIILSLYKYK